MLVPFSMDARDQAMLLITALAAAVALLLLVVVWRPTPLARAIERYGTALRWAATLLVVALIVARLLGL